MKTTTLFSASLALAAGLALATSAVEAAVLSLTYDPANGNLRLQNTTSSTQAFLSFDVLTLGNGSIGAVSGQPGNVGFLSGTGPFTPPASSFPTAPSNPNGLNGLYSQAGAINVGQTPVMTLAPYPGWSLSSPNGPVGSYWDLGNIAVTGMTQADLDVRFLTDPESTPPNYDTADYGKLLYFAQTGPTTWTADVGPVVGVVPEPSTLAIVAAAAGFGGFGAVSRRRKKAAANARSLSITA
ncbi:MAG: PEP-CTERM sorting domain-containing protein [Pirellulales bacterium]